MFVPAANPLGRVWVPDADLRGVLALPVLIVAGDGAVEALVADLDDAEITVDQDAPAGCGEFESRTVALINRGVPGFAVERDGTLHASLMRSCTGWPSGVWIDPPATQGPRRLQLPTAALEPHLRLRVGVRGRRLARDRDALAQRGIQPSAASRWRSTQGSGGLPADGSLLTVEPAGAVALGALKARGNPTAIGSATSVDPAACHPPAGRNHRRANRCRAHHRGGLRSSERHAADLLEMPAAAGDRRCSLHGYQIATLAARLDAKTVIDATGNALAPDAEAAQPLYARYWLHNRGPAPLGGLPAVAHLHPEARHRRSPATRCGCG